MMGRGSVRFAVLLIAALAFLRPLPAQGAERVKVVVSGVTGEVLENVRLAVVLPPGLVHDGQVERAWLERFRQQIPGRVRQAVEPYGYYHAEVDTELHVEGKRYRLSVIVHTGEPVLLDSVRVVVTGPGADSPKLLTLLDRFPLRTGAVLRQDLYEVAKGGLKARALDLGYLDADFSAHRIALRRETRRADLDLELETGPRYLFGEILLHGAPDYPEPFLRRYMALFEEEVFSYARLGQSQLNFLDSDRFKEVLITPRQELARDLRVPVNVQLVPSARRRLRPGIGYGTDTGARMSLNYRDLNVFHRGHELGAEVSLAERRQSLGGSYVFPDLARLDSQTALRAGFEREDVASFESRSLFAEIERLHGFGSGRTGSVYLRLLQEDYIVALEDARSRLVLPGIRFNHRNYADPVRPRQGFRYSLEVRGAHQDLGSDTGLLQVLAGGNVLVPLPARMTLFLRAEGGTTLKNEPLAEIPASLRFFAGGDQSVRGYPYRSLGPRDASGEVVGGEHLAVGSIELERALGKDWGVAIFYDAGSAFSAVDELEWAQGAGIGVRRYTAIGPVKLDLARQIGIDDPSYRVHVSMGFGW